MALRNKVESALQWNKQLIQNATKNNIIFNFVSSQIDFIQYKFDH